MNKQDDIKYNKWFKNYIEGVDIKNIEWHKLNYDQLMRFYYKNYFDEDYEEFVMSRGEDNVLLPFGMTYLPIIPQNSHDEYILGLCDNQNGTKTIVACVVFDPCYNINRGVLKSVTYIKTVETNTYFQKRGIFYRTIEEMLKFVNQEQNILTTHESVKGMLVNVIEKTRNIAKEHDFTGDIRSECEIDETYLESLKIVKSKKKVL